MFTSSESIDDVLLGVPATTHGAVSTCYTSKIGGSPLWISDEMKSQRHVNSMCCSHCQKEMRYVLQIYAPTDDLERALYVYCCPSSCATRSNGWGVVKDQTFKERNTKIDKEQEKLSSLVDKTLRTDWIEVCAPSVRQNDSAKPSSAWDLSGDDSDEDDFSALTAMIDARDDSLKGKAEVVSRSGGGGDSTSTPPPAGQVLPPPVGSTVGHVLGDKVRCSPHPSPGRRALIGQEVLLAEVYESECSASLSTHSNHIDSLFQKYMDETITNGEEDPQIISLLQQQQSKMHAKKKKQFDHEDSDDEFEDKDDEEFNNSIRQMQGLRKTLAIQQKQSGHEKTSVKQGCHPLTNMSKKEWALRRKSEDFFQKRYAVAPSQVMRYAYGGSPLWCFLPSPNTSEENVPRCPACSSPRVFEFQIMPALISHVDEAITNTGDEAIADNNLPRTPLDLSSGFDFGVVTVWCCPNSCGDCSREVVVVQPPSDFID